MKIFEVHVITNSFLNFQFIKLYLFNDDHFFVVKLYSIKK